MHMYFCVIIQEIWKMVWFFEKCIFLARGTDISAKKGKYAHKLENYAIFLQFFKKTHKNENFGRLRAKIAKLR